MSKSTTFKDPYGKILGYIEVDEFTGDKKVTDSYWRILGYYKKSMNKTTDAYGRILYDGDMSVALLPTKPNV